MQYKIPQNVQIEDKIVGPLTLRQLIYLGVGGGLAYALYTILASRYFIEVWLPPVAIITIITLAFTFLKINGIKFNRWILLAITYFYNPRKRIFMMGAGDNYNATIFAKEVKKEETVDTSKEKAARDKESLDKIGEISKVLDSYGKPAKSDPKL